MNTGLDLLVIHPWVGAEWRLQLGWLRTMSETLTGSRQAEVGGSRRSSPERMDTLAIPSLRDPAHSSISHMVNAGQRLSQTLHEAFHRRAAPTHLLSLEANVDTVVALARMCARSPVRDGVFLIDLTPEGWLAATTPFGLEAVTHLLEVLDRGGASATLFVCRSPVQEELGRSVQIPLIPVQDLPLTTRIHRPPPPVSASPQEPLAVAIGSLARALGLCTDGLPDAVRFAILMDAMARRYDLPLEWRRDLVAAGDRWATQVELDPAPTPSVAAIPNILGRLSSIGRTP